PRWPGRAPLRAVVEPVPSSAKERIWATCLGLHRAGPGARWRSPPSPGSGGGRRGAMRMAPAVRREAGGSALGSWRGELLGPFTQPVNEFYEGDARGADRLGPAQVRGVDALDRPSRVGEIRRGSSELPRNEGSAVVTPPRELAEI